MLVPSEPSTSRTEILDAAHESNNGNSKVDNDNEADTCEDSPEEILSLLLLMDYAVPIIRAVSRGLCRGNVPQEETLVRLCKSNSNTCSRIIIWQHVCERTMKKLNKLLNAEDITSRLPFNKNLTKTEWLLVDSVLVHQDYDVIGKTSTAVDRRVLVDLFELVVKFNIEDLEGHTLAQAWSNLTIAYNRKGRCSSPMLLQRRWYQLKLATRQRFDRFLLSNGCSHTGAREQCNCSPTPLQETIINHWKWNVYRTPLVQWRDLIKKRKVILREEFELMELYDTEPDDKLNVKEPLLVARTMQEISDDKCDDTETETDSDSEQPVVVVKEELEIVENDITSTTDHEHDINNDNSPIDETSDGLNDVIDKSNSKMQPKDTFNEQELEKQNVNENLEELPLDVDIENAISTVTNLKPYMKKAKQRKIRQCDNKALHNIIEILEENALDAKSFESIFSTSIIRDLNKLNKIQVKETNKLGNIVSNALEKACSSNNQIGDSRGSDMIKAENGRGFDEKLLMKPVVYLTRLEDMEGSPISLHEHVKDKKKKKIYNPNTRTKTKSNKPPKRFKLSSDLFKKPFRRHYSCSENPDFYNSREDLTKTFISANKKLLKRCIPVTIDVNKDFEKHLVNGVMYLASDHNSSLVNQIQKPHNSSLINQAQKPHNSSLVNQTEKPHNSSLVNQTEKTHNSSLVNQAQNPHNSSLVNQAQKPHNSSLVNQAQKPHNSSLVNQKEMWNNYSLVNQKETPNNYSPVNQAQKLHNYYSSINQTQKPTERQKVNNVKTYINRNKDDTELIKIKINDIKDSLLSKLVQCKQSVCRPYVVADMSGKQQLVNQVKPNVGVCTATTANEALDERLSPQSVLRVSTKNKPSNYDKITISTGPKFPVKYETGPLELKLTTKAPDKYYFHRSETENNLISINKNVIFLTTTKIPRNFNKFLEFRRHVWRVLMLPNVCQLDIKPNGRVTLNYKANVVLNKDILNTLSQLIEKFYQETAMTNQSDDFYENSNEPDNNYVKKSIRARLKSKLGSLISESLSPIATRAELYYVYTQNGLIFKYNFKKDLLSLVQIHEELFKDTSTNLDSTINGTSEVIISNTLVNESKNQTPGGKLAQKLESRPQKRTLKTESCQEMSKYTKMSVEYSYVGHENSSTMGNIEEIDVKQDIDEIDVKQDIDEIDVKQDIDEIDVKQDIDENMPAINLYDSLFEVEECATDWCPDKK